MNAAEAQLHLAVLHARMDKMPVETQQQIKGLAMEISGMINNAGPQVGPAALALVSLAFNLAAARAKAG